MISKMKKALSILMIVVCVVCCVSLSSCKTFFGYYYSLDDARNESKFYTDSDYLFTKELEESVIDFIVKDHVLHIVEIKVDNEKNSQKFRIKHSSSFSIEESIYEFEQSEAYNWTSSTKLSLNMYEWCIVTDEFNSNNDNYSSFEFMYNDTLYCICYNMDVIDGSAS